MNNLEQMNMSANPRSGADDAKVALGAFHVDESRIANNNTAKMIVGVVVALVVIAIGAYVYVSMPPSVTPAVTANDLPSPSPPVVPPG
jgi:hypothetical protein